VRRKLRDMRPAAGERYQPPGLRIEVRPQGLDVLHADDAAWLRDTVNAAKPALLVIGPSYKLVGGEAEKELPARTVTALIDRLRVEHGCAVLLEAHTPYAPSGQRKRPLRPYGSSLWARWPEFGIHLDKGGLLTHWRGVREEDRGWPAALTRGDKWPWTVDINRHLDVEPLSPSVVRVLAALTDALDPLSVKDIGDVVAKDGQGMPLTARTIQRAVDTLGDRLDSTTIDKRGTRVFMLLPPNGEW